MQGYTIKRCQHSSGLRQLGRTQTLPTWQRNHGSSNAFINNSVFGNHIKTLYMNKNRYVVRQARLYSHGFKFDNGRIFIISVAKFLWWLVVDVAVGETTVSKWSSRRFESISGSIFRTMSKVKRLRIKDKYWNQVEEFKGRLRRLGLGRKFLILF